MTWASISVHVLVEILLVILGGVEEGGDWIDFSNNGVGVKRILHLVLHFLCKFLLFLAVCKDC